MLAALKQTDPPASHIKTIPIEVLKHIAFVAENLLPTSDLLQATADMIIIAFFFLLCLGEYTDSSSTDATLFILTNVQLFIHHCRLDLYTASRAELLQACSASFVFTCQKNGIKNKVLHLGQSGNPFLCHVLALVHGVLHLHHHNAPTTTPLAHAFTSFGPQGITSSFITSQLCQAVTILGMDLGFLPSEVSTCSLHAARAMALIVANIDTNIIQLMGQWHSDEMFWYLHLSAEPITKIKGCGVVWCGVVW